MANALGVCLFAVLVCCTNLSLARQVPKECSKGPSYWCQSLKIASSCGAVGHCSATVWETKSVDVTANEVSNNFVRLFRQLKDIKDLLNEDYLAARVSSACHDVPYPAIAKICKDNTAGLEKYVQHVLKSDASAETMCAVIGMCNNQKVENVLSQNKKKSEPAKKKIHLLGNAKCTWGPSYWCSNISTSHDCKAASHCVSRVWSKATFPEDTDSICKICTDMVTQARDQLQSNETQVMFDGQSIRCNVYNFVEKKLLEELKQVFEGSCQLIPIKIVAKECMKLADDFVPELVETLSSEMNPQTVCSVAGLCNNAKIDEMLVEYNARLQLRVGCTNCGQAVSGLRKKFDATSYEDFLVGLLQVCRKMSSLSDSCSMLVFKYYENIVDAVRKDLTPQSVCHVSGQCAYKFHSHDDFTFPDVSKSPVGDNVPCQFCEQLVQHLRDTMVANTTELEFYKILQGLCKQTGNFKTECLHLAEEYYPMIYQFLTQELKPQQICAEMGVCLTKPSGEIIAPLILTELADKDMKFSSTKLIGGDNSGFARVSLEKQSNVAAAPTPVSTADIAGVLPIERMFVSVPQPEGKAVCSFCQYFLHYVQVELSDTTTIEKVTEVVDGACDKLPRSVNGECRQFVEQYGPAVVALLVQEIDPASVCPGLGLCPKLEEVHRVSVGASKSGCPLCLFAVEQLETVLKNNRSEESIRAALDGLCSRLAEKLRAECVQFVDTYSSQLVEMLVANLDAQEICVYLKLCTDQLHDPLKITKASNPIDKYHEQPQLRGDRNNFRKKSLLPKNMLVEQSDIETNEIPDNTVNGRPVKPVKAPKTVCVVCEFVLKEIDDQIKDKHNRDEIMAAVHGVCKRMPKSVQPQCDQFVQKYGELVISLLTQELEPSKVCEELKLCPPTALAAVKVEEILDCAVCETVVMAVKKVLSNDKVDRDIVHVIEKSCAMLPAKYSARCHTMMEIYGDSVIHLIEQFGIKGVCQKIGLCSDSGSAYVRMYREKRY